MTLFKVFGNSGTDLGNVRQLPPTTFADFVKEILGHPVLVNLTRDQFHNLDKESKGHAKRVAYVTPATFSSNPSKRLYEHATTFSLIALDIDDPVQAGPFVSDASQLHFALEPFSFAAYTTASSLPHAPKLRIFVQADNLPIAIYADSVKAIAARLGLPTVTKESLVVVQPMYLPTMFRDDDPETAHPLIAATWDGQAVTRGDVGTGTGVTSGGATGKPTPFSVDGDDLDYLRPTVEAVTIDDAREALNHLDPDMVYNEWLEVAASLRHQFPNEPEASEAYELFDEWSAKGDKYVDSDDTMAKWSSLRPTPTKRAPVTIRTLLHKAQEAGWDSLKLSTKCYAATMKWICDAAREGNQLMAEGVKRIAATPLLSPLERGTLLSGLQDALKAKGLKILRTELKKELQKLERATNKREDPKVTPDNQLPPWARGICYVGATNEFCHRAAGRKMKPEVLDAQYNVFLTEEDSANGKPTMLARDFLLNIAKIPRVDAYRYDPAHPEQAFVSEGKLRFLNTYLPTYPEANAIMAEPAGEIFLEHIANLIHEAEYQQTLVDWCAYLVQNPGAKVRWAPLIQSAEGAGKTFIPAAMMAVLGRTNVNLIDGHLLLKDNFNGWATGAQVCAIEEIRVVGHNRHEVMNRLKPCITNDFITIRDMWEKAYLAPNNVNYILLTNFHDSIAVSENDRRYFVLYSALQSKAQVRALGEPYFVRLYDMLRDNAAGLRSFLEDWTISPTFNPNGHAPVTKYLGELMKASASPLNAAVSDAINDEDHPLVKRDLISSKQLKNVLDGITGLPRFTDQNLASVLRELDYVLLGRFRVNDERHYLWTRRGSQITEDNAAETARVRMEAGTGSESPFEDVPSTELLG